MQLEHLSIMLKGHCPKCDYENNSEEVHRTGSKDNFNFKVSCANCQNRFLAHLEVEGSNPKELMYLDDNQLFQAIHDAILHHKRQLAGYSFLKEKHPHLFWNLLHHYKRYECGIFMFRTWRTRFIEKLYGCTVRY